MLLRLRLFEWAAAGSSTPPLTTGNIVYTFRNNIQELSRMVHVRYILAFLLFLISSRQAMLPPT
jgi:hypothetical protein